MIKQAEKYARAFVRRGGRFLFLLYLFLFPAVSGLLYAVEPDLTAGDHAFAAKDYAVAASFYTRYLQKMKKTEDPQKIREAYERLMDSLLFGQLTSEAEKLLQEYLARYPGVNPVAAGMWKGKLLMQKGQVQEAVTLFEKLLADLPGSDPSRISALSAYADALEISGRYREAAEIYRKLLSVTGKSVPGGNILLKLLLACIHASDFSAAEKLLSGKEKDLLSAESRELLYAYLLLKKDPEKEKGSVWKALLAQYSSLPGNTPAKTVKKDPLLYRVASAYADSELARGEFASAVESGRLAYYAAGSNKELFNAISRIIRIVEKSGNGKEAALLAEKQLQLFRHTMVDTSVKQRTAELLLKNDRLESAAKLHESIFHDIRNPWEVQKESFRKYLYIKLRMNEFPSALRHVRGELANRKREAEGEMLVAEALESAGKVKESIETYRELGKKYPLFASEAFYKAVLLAIKEKDREQVIMLSGLLESAGDIQKQFLKEMPYIHAVKNVMEGKKREAEALLEKYLADPSNRNIPEALSFAGILALEKKEYGKAEQYLLRITNEYPSYRNAPLAVYWLIHIYTVENKEAAAEKMTMFLAGKYPDSSLTPDALFEYFRSCMDKGAYGKGSEVLRKLSSLEIVKRNVVKYEGRILCAESLLEEKRNNREKAVKILEDVIKKYPQGQIFQEACCRLGEIYYRMNEVDKAVIAYTKASVAAGSDPLLTYAAQGALGNILLSSRSQDTESLKQALECFLAIAGESTAPAEFRAEASYKAGRCLELLGEKTKADIQYKQLLYSFPAEKLHEETLAALWCVKAAEKLVDSAVKTPILSAFENAKFALHYLHNGGLLTREEAEKRFERLKKLKFNP